MLSSFHASQPPNTFVLIFFLDSKLRWINLPKVLLSKQQSWYLSSGTWLLYLNYPYPYGSSIKANGCIEDQEMQSFKMSCDIALVQNDIMQNKTENETQIWFLFGKTKFLSVTIQIWVLWNTWTSPGGTPRLPQRTEISLSSPAEREGPGMAMYLWMVKIQ